VPGESYSISVIWRDNWSHFGYYINVQKALTRSEFGFDYMDWTLDIEVSPDLREWHVKDDDELEEAVHRGVYTAAHASEIHDAAKRGLDHLLSRRPPFDRDWSDWRPDPSWPAAVLPERWE
jgi:predicted RNA-binding protein associated with RNAse of E/G family